MQMYVVCEKEEATKEDGEGEHRTHSNGLVGRKHTHIHIYIYVPHLTQQQQSSNDKNTPIS
jgi:hypothetical protein